MLGSHFTHLAVLAFVALPSLVSGHDIPIAGAAPMVKRASGFDVLVEGNQKFKDTVQPGLLEDLTTNGQSPAFMFIGCSDSRVSEGTIFSAPPGTLFTERNIANQFHEYDGNANSVMSYAIDVLGSTHIIVMGHYGCGGVAAAIATPPEGVLDASSATIQEWIQPIRKLFETSERPEIVALRNANKDKAVVEEPDIREPGFRALVEENVKVNVARIAAGSTLKNHYLRTAEGKVAARAEGGASQPVFVHGLVYDLENGNIIDLKISVGPPGVAIQESPFPAAPAAQNGAQTVVALENASSGTQTSETQKRAACEVSCKSKRTVSWN